MLARNGSYYCIFVTDDLTAFQFPFFGTRSSSAEFHFWLYGPTDKLHPTSLACNCQVVLWLVSALRNRGFVRLTQSAVLRLARNDCYVAPAFFATA